MRHWIVFSLIGVLAFTLADTASADIVEFRLLGNAGEGLLEGNVTPGTGSAGEGGVGSTGLTYDTDTNILHVDVGWGTGNGYSGDMTGTVTMLHLHGPTDAPPPDAFSQTGPLMVVLSNTTNFNGSPIEGGVVDNYFINQSDEEALLAGRTYINVHTDMFAMGEIRGYLVAASSVPEPGSVVIAAMFLMVGLRRQRRQ